MTPLTRATIHRDAPGSRLVEATPSASSRWRSKQPWPNYSKSPPRAHTSAYRGGYNVLLISMWWGLPPPLRSLPLVTLGAIPNRSRTATSRNRKWLPQSRKQLLAMSAKWRCDKSPCSSSSPLSPLPTLASSSTPKASASRSTCSMKRQPLPLPRWRSKKSARRAARARATSTNFGTR